jgi:hypothetical protein
MQIQGHDIRGAKGSLRQIGQKEFIDDSVTDEPDLAFLFLAGLDVRAIEHSIVFPTCDIRAVGRCHRLWSVIRPVLRYL